MSDSVGTEYRSNANTFVPPPEYRIVLVGRSGEGKSTTANTIFGEKIFEARAAAASVTPECQFHKATVDGRSVFIVDTPGLFDTKKSDDETKKEILKCIAITSPGPHVILLVMKVGRYTNEVKQTYRKVRDILGNEGHQHTIVVFTCGDDLTEDKIQFDDYFAKAPSGLKRILFDAGKRYVVFNNRLQGVDGQQQVHDLLTAVDDVIAINRGGWFKSHTYDAAEGALQIKETERRESIKLRKDVEESQLKNTLEKTRKEIGTLKTDHKREDDLLEKKNQALVEFEREYREQLRTGLQKLESIYESRLIEIREETRDDIKDGILNVSDPWFLGKLKGAGKKIPNEFGF